MTNNTQHIDPLHIIDARNPKAVARWLETWLTGPPNLTTGALAFIVGNVLAVSVRTHDGMLATYKGPKDNGTYHASRADLVAYVVAWARNITNEN
jgi:hypothetical protein